MRGRFWFTFSGSDLKSPLVYNSGLERKGIREVREPERDHHSRKTLLEKRWDREQKYILTTITLGCFGFWLGGCPV